MKVAYFEKFGPPEVFEIREMPKPEPEADEILIKVHASAVNAAECNGRGLTHIPPGLGWIAKLMLGTKGPKIKVPGASFSGVIEAVGEKVHHFKVGDEVFGSSSQQGGYAEYTCQKANGVIVHKPEQISHEAAATLPYGALTAMYFLKEKARVKAGQKVLVKGAAGDVGMFAVQIARHYGADVTGVCSTARIEMVKSLGANKIIDYTKEDFTKSDEQWDIIFDNVLGHTSFKQVKKVLTPKGYYLAIAGGLKEMLQMVQTSIFGGRKVIFGGGEACEITENLALIAELSTTGKLRPIIDRSFPLEKIVEAHQYYESGKRKGAVAVKVS